MILIITKLIIAWLESPLLCLSDISLQRRVGGSRINVFASNYRRWQNSLLSDWKTAIHSQSKIKQPGDLGDSRINQSKVRFSIFQNYL